MLDAIAQWTGQVHWIILKPLKPIIALPQTKNNQIHVLWKRSKAKFLNHTHLCSSCLDASNDLQAILLLGHFHPSGTWNDYCLLNWKPFPRLHIISLFCVSWRTYLHANSDPRSHNSNPNDYTSSLESALKLFFFNYCASGKH